jgi:ferredoxin-NADP reductase
MHPVEHLLYFSVVLIHWVIPSHPLHFLFNSQHTALTPAPGHTGFEGKIGKFISFGSYFHYLHHRLFDCNYGESTIPMDKWFGIFEDGSQTQTEKFEAASAYQKLIVSKIVDESPEVKSFYLSSTDNSKLKQNIPGQHLIFKIPFRDKRLCIDPGKANGSQIKYALRSYTVSNNTENNQYRISVKFQKGGQVSPALHGSLELGAILEAKGPKGMFVHQYNKRKPSVFIAAGIGITPILSILKSIDKTNKEIFLFFAAKEENLLCFKEEIHQICKDHQNINVQVFFSRKPVENMHTTYNLWQYHATRLDMDVLKTILPGKKNFNFYICGPEKMTASFIDGIKLWKGKQSAIYTETFGTEKNTKNKVESNREIQVHFTKSNKSVNWDYDYSNILEFAESNGIRLEAGCMFGECGACSTKIELGNVAYNYNTAIKPAKGNCLPCSCFPTSDIRLDA